MKDHFTFSPIQSRLREFISRSSRREGAHSGQPHFAEEFNRLALALFALQFQHVAPYRRFCEMRSALPGKIQHWKEIPAVPTTAFKEWELTSLPENERIQVFHSSGTTEHRPSRHFHNAESLSLYEASLLPWFQQNFLGAGDALEENGNRAWDDPCGFIILTPPPALAPHSSLVHMFETVRCELGSRDSFFGGRLDATGAWALDLDQILFGLRKSMCANRPIAILGTAFSFVHLLDHFADKNMRYKLAVGSRVLETGGYKGRSREMPKSELHHLIQQHLGIAPARIICEYGMSELSSQAYDSTTENLELKTQNSARVFHFPPWCRAQIISPETNEEVTEGETGLLRLCDLANVRSVLAIQTEDLAVRRGEGFELIGRAQLAEARGCSLMTK